MELRSLPPSLVAVEYYTIGLSDPMFGEYQTASVMDPARRREGGAGVRKPGTDLRSLYDVFVAIRNDESDHVHTMTTLCHVTREGGHRVVYQHSSRLDKIVSIWSAPLRALPSKDKLHCLLYSHSTPTHNTVCVIVAQVIGIKRSLLQRRKFDERPGHPRP